MAVVGIVVAFLVSLAMTGPSWEAPAPPVSVEEKSQEIALAFVKNEATFRFDGIETTLELEGKAKTADGDWIFAYKYESRYGGYGDRTGKSLNPVTTPHHVKITIKNYRVAEGIIDEIWNMLAQTALSP